MTLSAADKTNLRDTQHRSTLNLSVFKPATILSARVNNASIARGARSIDYDSGTGSFSLIRSYQALWVGKSEGLHDLGVVRIKSITGSATSGTITVDENGIDWEDNRYLTIKHHYPPFAIAPRIASQVFYKFYDTAYSDQNSQPPPVCIAGTHQIGRLSNGSLVFSIDLSNSYAIAQGATISSYALSVSPAGATVNFNTSTGIGTVTVSADGDWWATCSCTDSNSKTQERFVLLKADSSPYIDYQLNSYSAAWGQGVNSSFTVYGDVTLDDFPDEAIVYEWYDNEFDGVSSFVNVLDTGDNIVSCSYIRKDTSRDDFSTGAHAVTFNASTIDNIIDNISLDSVTLDAVNSPSKWYEYARWMTVGRAIHHLLKWHSSILELTDVIGLLDNILGVKTVRFEKGTLRGMANQLANDRGIFAQLTSDRLGRLHLAEDTQMLDGSGRSAVGLISDIIEQDVSGTVTTVHEPEGRVATVQVSGFNFDGVSSVALISIAPGYRESGVSYSIPNHRGSGIINKTRQVLGGQNDANVKAGRLLAVANNAIREIRITFRGNYIGALTTIPTQGWYRMAIANSSLARELPINWKRMICRSVRLSYQGDGRFATDAVFEQEALGPDGIKGNYPTSIPSVPIVTPSPPVWEVPGAGLPALLSFSSVFYRDDDDTDWTSLNSSAFNHGTIDAWWRVKKLSANPEVVLWWAVGDSGLVHRFDTITGSATDITPVDDPPNTWADATAPTVSDLTMFQVLCDPFIQDRFYIIAEMQNGSSQYRGWLLVTDDNGDTFDYVNLSDGVHVSVETRPLWMAVNGTYLLVAIWDDDAADDIIKLLVFTKSPVAYSAQYAMGSVTSAEIDAKTYWAFPVTRLDDDDEWYLAGRMNAPQGLADPEHVIKTTNTGSSWSSVENTWGTDRCAAFHIDTDGDFYAVRNGG